MRYVVLIALAVIAGCAAPVSNKMNTLSLGMTKAEVISVMGHPKSTAAADGVEYMQYRLASSVMTLSTPSDYFVRIVNGRVDAFGQRGDFDSTKDPTLVLKHDVTVK